MAIDSRRELFLREYIKDFSGAEAARRTGVAEGSARSFACRTLAEPEVQERLAEIIAERSKKADISAEAVLREIHAIATTDVNELVEHRRVCCRHCWGIDHRYQYTTEDKLQAAARTHAEAVRRGKREFDKSDLALVEDFVYEEFMHGGIGFDPKREPHPDCPDCAGEGYGEVHIKDTRFLSPGARALYAGAKVGKNGIEISLHDKSKHLELLARHLGLLNDKLEVKGDITLIGRLLASRKRVGG